MAKKKDLDTYEAAELNDAVGDTFADAAVEAPAEPVARAARLVDLSDAVKKEIHANLSFWLSREGYAGTSLDVMHADLRRALGQVPEQGDDALLAA